MAEKVCPAWVGYLLSCPLRKLWENPRKILEPYIGRGMITLDVGCAMGFFSLPIARMVGRDGLVICVDMQEKMIRSLEKRARKAGLSGIVETLVCTQDSTGLDDYEGKIDFALASAVVHEVPDSSGFFSDIFATLKSDGKFLVIEPKGHVSEEDFNITVETAEKTGFSILDNPRISRSRSVLLGKQV
jgi:ubiquinone/menaquinone biosynthesis C-methylase UbiE